MIFFWDFFIYLYLFTHFVCLLIFDTVLRQNLTLPDKIFSKNLNWVSVGQQFIYKIYIKSCVGWAFFSFSVSGIRLWLLNVEYHFHKLMTKCLSNKYAWSNPQIIFVVHVQCIASKNWYTNYTPLKLKTLR